MTYFRSRHWRLMLTTLMITAAPAPLLAQSAPLTPAAGQAISDHLNTLASNPHDLRALLGAGEAAITLEDPNAAISFFARAEEIDPRNARAKAGLGRALLMLEKPQDALRLFHQATDYGMAEASIAGDRGLAYDLRGDQRKAQRDYVLALRSGENPEITRRLALSYAISGERDQALKLIEPLLYKQDKAAWRVRAFILALAGDTEAANGVARQVMPGNLARPMAPFFARLPSLNAAEKAAAVHFGHIPSDGRTGEMLYARNETPQVQPTPAPVTQPTPGGTSGTVARTTTPAPSRSTVPVRSTRTSRTGANLAATTAAQQNSVLAAREASGAQTVQAVPSRTTAPAAPTATAPTTQPTRSTPTQTTMIGSAAGTTTPSSATRNPTSPVLTPDTRAVVMAPARASPSQQEIAAASARLAAIVGGLSLETPVIVAPPRPATAREANVVAAAVEKSPFKVAEPRAATPKPAVAPAEPKPAATKPEPKKPIEKKTPEAKAPDKKTPEKPTPDKKPAPDKKAADKKAPDKKTPPKKVDPKVAEPARLWAQLLTGQDKAALARDFGKLEKKAPAAFKGKSAWTAASARNSNRLLVGPFATAKAARDFLDAAKVEGFVWSSPAGEAVQKLDAK